MDRHHGRPGPTARRLTLAAMSLGFGVVQLDVTIVNVALNSIGTAQGGGVASLQWVVNAYTIVFAALILTAGALGDRLGARRVFLAGFALFTLASAACALAPGIGTLIAARAVQGAGAAMLVPNSLALLNHAYPEEDARHRAVGLWAAGASLALSAGPVAGGALIAAAGWRSIFLVNLPIGAAGLWLAWRHAPTVPAAGRRSLDLPGQVLAVLALGGLAAATIEGGQRDWSDPRVLAGFILFAVLAASFIVVERSRHQPMLPLDLFRRPAFAATALAGLLVNVAFYGLVFLLGLYFQRAEGMSALDAGLAFLPMMGAVLASNLAAARLSRRFGARAAIVAGAAGLAAGCLALLAAGAGTPYRALALPLAALGGGIGLLVPPLTATMLGSVEKQRSGVASGVLNALRQTGSVLGVALFGALIGRPLGLVGGFHAALAVSAALLAAAVAAVLWGVPARRSGETAASSSPPSGQPSGQMPPASQVRLPPDGAPSIPRRACRR